MIKIMCIVYDCLHNDGQSHCDLDCVTILDGKCVRMNTTSSIEGGLSK